MTESTEIRVQKIDSGLTKSQLEILSYLKNRRENINFSEKYEMPLHEMVNRSFLHSVASLSLSYEISLVEQNNEGILATGVLDGGGIPAAGSEDIIELHKTGRISIHSHTGQKFIDLCPSPGDIEILGMYRVYKGSRKPAMIMNSQGILILGFEPDFLSLETKEDDSGKYSWKLKNRCLWEFERLHRCVAQNTLTLDESIQQFLNFQKDNGIIKLHKTWNDVTDADLSFLQEKG